MSELEESCIKLLKFSGSNFVNILQSFDTKQLDQLITEYSKLEQTLLHTSNNLNQVLIESEKSNQKIIGTLR
ncbi:hypothetical protein pb186bvf_010607 [Paramecium bursaria]